MQLNRFINRKKRHLCTIGMFETSGRWAAAAAMIVIADMIQLPSARPTNYPRIQTILVRKMFGRFKIDDWNQRMFLSLRINARLPTWTRWTKISLKSDKIKTSHYINIVPLLDTFVIISLNNSIWTWLYAWLYIFFANNSLNTSTNNNIIEKKIIINKFWINFCS